MGNRDVCAFPFHSHGHASGRMVKLGIVVDPCLWMGETQRWRQLAVAKRFLQTGPVPTHHAGLVLSRDPLVGNSWRVVAELRLPRVVLREEVVFV